MAEAFGWGLFGGLALLIGALLSFGSFITSRVLGLAMAFGAGVLISAVSFDLVEEAFTTSDQSGTVGFGLLAGALVFFLGDAAIDRMGGATESARAAIRPSDSPFGIVLGAVLDGIPESIVLGATLLTGEGISTAFVVAVFISNLPEGLAGSTGLARAGWSRRHIIELWSLVALVSATAAALGYVSLDGASPEITAFTLAFAGGAVLTMLADTMMPEAFEHGGRVVGLVTTVGFGVAFFLHNLRAERRSLRALRKCLPATGERRRPVLVEHPVEGASVLAAVVVLGLGGLGGAHEAPHEGGVLDAGRRLDAARHVDAPRANPIDRLGHVVRREASGQQDPKPRGRPLGEGPVEHLARAGALGVDHHDVGAERGRSREVRVAAREHLDHDRHALADPSAVLVGLVAVELGGPQPRLVGELDDPLAGLVAEDRRR